MTELLRTGRLTLTPVGADDLDWFHALNAHADVRKFLWDDRIIAREASEEIIRKNQIRLTVEGWGLWKAEHDGSPVGYYGLWPFFEEAQPQLIYVTAPDCCGNGYAAEASRAVLDHAFTTLGFTYIDAATDTDNLASQKVAAALGFAQTGERMADGKPTLFYRKMRSV